MEHDLKSNVIQMSRIDYGKVEKFKHRESCHFVRVVAMKMEKGTWHDLGFEEVICHNHCTIDQPLNTVQKEQDMKVGVEEATIL